MFISKSKHERDMRYAQEEIRDLNEKYWDLNNKYSRLMRHLGLIEVEQPARKVIKEKGGAG